jgi:hypothetical protein
MSRKRRIHLGIGVAATLAIVLTLVVGLRAFEGGNLNKARRIAAQLQADAVAHPNSIGTATPSVQSLPAAPSPAPATTGVSSTHNATAPAIPAAATHTAAPATTTPPPSNTKVAAPKFVTNPVKVIATSSVAPWRQPTATEVDEAISAVHSLVPFFTPTPTQILTSGVQVCTALDQGESFSAVEADALNMIGASSYSWAIPQSAQTTAIETLVALYCPANAAKLS